MNQLPLEIIVHVLSSAASLVNSTLDSLPLKLKKRCPKLTARDVEDIRRIIVRLQNDLSQMKVDKFGDVFIGNKK